MNIRSILMPTLPRYPTESQWEELELQLDRELFSELPAGITLREALTSQSARWTIAGWRRRHGLEEQG